MGSNMKNKIIITLILFTTLSIAQQTYELTPGVKGNQIVLQLSNISQTQSAEDVEVKLIKQSENLTFSKTEAEIKYINTAEEKEATFEFEVKYSSKISKADTVEFLITDNQTIHFTKQFIFSYTQPKEFRLEQNYPNPFNPTTKIRYTVAPPNLPKVEALGKVTLKIFDILGNEVATLVNEEKESGYHEVDFNASKIASGVYIYRLMSGKFILTKKMMVLR
jgi:hypothetical protein